MKWFLFLTDVLGIFPRTNNRYYVISRTKNWVDFVLRIWKSLCREYSYWLDECHLESRNCVIYDHLPIVLHGKCIDKKERQQDLIIGSLSFLFAIIIKRETMYVCCLWFSFLASLLFFVIIHTRKRQDTNRTYCKRIVWHLSHKGRTFDITH
jgi:hypothetical protein